MVVQIDSREKARAIRTIIQQFEENGVKHFTSKLLVGDYCNLDNPKIIVDRKQNLTEVCQNVCQDHERFRNELIKAKECEIKLIILIEHGQGINSKEDVIWWKNPRSKKSPKATSGETLYQIMTTMERKYGVEWQFCDKSETGNKILEILEDKKEEKENEKN